jgi:hypothetical protein
MQYGYRKKILQPDLTHAVVREEMVKEELLLNFLGGRSDKPDIFLGLIFPGENWANRIE